MSTDIKQATARGVWALRGLMAAGVLLALFAGIPEGYRPAVFVIGVVAVGALVTVFRPDHLGASITIGIVIFWWALHLHSEMPVAVLVAAAGLVVAHVAATLLAYGPPELPLDTELAVLWAVRGAMTWTAALAVWVVARVHSGHGSPAVFWLTGLTGAAVAAVVAAVATPLRGKESRR